MKELTKQDLQVIINLLSNATVQVKEAHVVFGIINKCNALAQDTIDHEIAEQSTI